MSRAVTVLQGLLLLLASVFVFINPWLPMLAVRGARWDTEPTPDQHGQVPTIRGDLPRWAMWMQTLDDWLPGGTYEPTVAALLQRWGRYWCSVYWIGWRNRSHGLRRTFGRPSTAAAYFTHFEPDAEGFVYGIREDGTWYWALPLGPLRMVAGYRIYRLPGEQYLAVPTATIKRA